MRVDMQDAQIRMYPVQGSQLRQADHAVAAHRHRDDALAGDAPHRLFDRRKGLLDHAWHDPGIAAIDEAQVLHRIEIVHRRLVAPHQRGLFADRRGPEPRADAHRVRAGIERQPEHRRLGAAQLPGLRRAHEALQRREDRRVEDAHRLSPFPQTASA
jgi:hypothetical protein